ISMKSYRLAENTNDGLYMEDVKLVEMDTPMIIGNGGNGLHIHFTSNSVLDGEGYYGLLININSYSNSWNGLKFTYDPLHLTKKVKLDISRITIHSNMGGDIISAEQVHIDWNTMDIDLLGTDTSVGVVRANMDIDIEGPITIQNMNISLIGTDRKITVNEGMSLTLNNCDIRAVTPNYGFSIDVLEGASLEVNGGLLSPLSSLHAVNALELKMTDTLIRYGEAPVIVEGTEITLDGCRFENVDGEALLIKGSKGNITRTSFSSNTIGIMIDGLSGDLTIDNSSFKDNSWGVYLFEGGSHHLNMTMCDLTDNSPSGVRVKGGEANLLDCSLDSSALSVVGSAGMIYVKYTLTVEVLNEIGENEVFSLKIEKGDDTTDHEAIPDQFFSPLVTYEIDEGGTTDLSRIDLTMTYEEGTEKITITLDSRRHIIFNGYRAPVPTKENFTISALEDIGIDAPLGTVDLSLWFSDLGGDGETLSFSFRVGTPEITPVISGSLLSLELKENWWGYGNFTLIAKDQYGMTTSILVDVEVDDVNDVPVASNARIDPINPRSGDTIKAKWEWSDVDEGDYQLESTYFIKWYLNGVYQPDHDNALEIAGVRHEQVWNFTIYPADQFSWTNGQFGPGASSSYVIVFNSAPVLDDVLITTRYPKTTTDLLAQPGEWSDIESNMVIFHYQWEIRKKIDTEYVWIPLGAPDSPILSNQFTKKDDSIRVGAWASDGIATSDIVYSEVKIQNSLPRIISAELTPSILDETIEIISVSNVAWEDDDGDDITLYFNWEVGGTSIALPPEYSELRWDIGGWNYPNNPNVTVRITPKDDEVLAGYGETFVITLQMTPMDTDGDGDIDMYDDDDDGDGFDDIWEEYMGSDPKSPFSRPVDTDMDGDPDGVKYNPETWMDIDDDNDGILDDADSSPLNPAMPGDMDGDHIGNDVDPDIDGDGVPNEKDFAPYNPYVTSKDEENENKVIETITLILLLLIFLGIIVVIFLFLTGRLELPVNAPPPAGGEEVESAEAIFDDDDDEGTGAGKKELALQDFEDDDLEDMKVCSNCGELVSGDTDICPNCDAEFDDEDYEE
ncbi:MAG: right-handed parallel beta-helix repeat-containing protein, partial [Thermoplasmata archaeon]|nr:right-handed parallel beta-helix repeat-containing protein [Thermoplasmata archaeon]